MVPFFPIATLLLALASTSAQALASSDSGSSRNPRLSRRALPANCALKIDTATNRCGLTYKSRCKAGVCCSAKGYCGTSTAHCGKGCLPGFGTCTGKTSLVCVEPKLALTTTTKTRLSSTFATTTRASTTTRVSTTSRAVTTSSTISATAALKTTLKVSSTLVSSVRTTTASTTRLTSSSTTRVTSTTTTRAASTIATTTRVSTVVSTTSSTSRTLAASSTVPTSLPSTRTTTILSSSTLTASSTIPTSLLSTRTTTILSSSTSVASSTIPTSLPPTGTTITSSTSIPSTSTSVVSSIPSSVSTSTSIATTTPPPSISTTSTTSSPSSTSISPDATFCARKVDSLGGTCGGVAGNRCNVGYCCSPSGYCGTTSAYCSAGCQTPFGSCIGFTAPTCSGTTVIASGSGTVTVVSTSVSTTASTTAFGTSTIASGTAIAVPTGATSAKFVIFSDLWLTNGSPPPSSSLAGFNVFILSFFMTTGAVDMALGWQWLTNAQRAAVRTDYKNAGIKLLVSAFGATDSPTTLGVNPIYAANAIADWVILYGVDGVDVDYEDFDAFNAGKSEAWIIAYTRQLRARLPSPYILTHAPVAPWFTDQPGAYPNGGYLAIDRAVGSFIDYYNLQFYNQGENEYTTCESLLNRSTVFQHASLFEIAASGVPLNKLIIGKPAIPSDASNGYMTPSLLGSCVAQAKARGWSGGVMLWQYPNAPAGFVDTVWNAPLPVTTAAATTRSIA